MIDTHIIGLVLVAVSIIAILSQLAKLFMLGYENGYRTDLLHLDASVYRDIYITSIVPEVQGRLYDELFGYFMQSRQQRSDNNPQEIASRIQRALDRYFLFSELNRNLLQRIILNTIDAVRASLERMPSADTSESEIRYQAQDIVNSLMPDLLRLAVDDLKLNFYKFQGVYIVTYRNAVSALASAITLGSIGFVIYKLG